NQRNCGGTEHLSATLYHSGLTADVDILLRQLQAEGHRAIVVAGDSLGGTLKAEGHRAIVVAGYSLGANLALKLAGDYASAPPASLRGVVAVSPVMDLPRCVDALERKSNLIYQWNFVRNLKARMRRKAAAFPALFSTDPLASIQTVRQFDEAYTAPFFGFQNATDYYYRAAALRVVDRISVPALVVTDADYAFVTGDRIV